MYKIYKVFDMYSSPINYACDERKFKDFNDGMLPHDPTKHARGQNNAFLNHITYEVLQCNCSFMN